MRTEFIAFCYSHGWDSLPVLKEETRTILDGSHEINVREDVSGTLTILTVASASATEDTTVWFADKNNRQYWFALFRASKTNARQDEPLSTADILTLASWQHYRQKVHYIDRGAIEALLRVAIQIGHREKGATAIRFEDILIYNTISQTVIDGASSMATHTFYPLLFGNTMFEEACKGCGGQFVREMDDEIRERAPIEGSVTPLGPMRTLPNFDLVTIWLVDGYTLL